MATSDIQIHVGDFVSAINHGEQKIGQILKVTSNNLYHVNWFILCTDTVLGEVRNGNRQEIFQTDECQDIKKRKIKDKVNVTRLPLMARWAEEVVETPNLLFYQKRYEKKFGRFCNLLEHEGYPAGTCSNCEHKKNQEILEIPVPTKPPRYQPNSRNYIVDAVSWRGQVLKPGENVFLTPGSLKLPKMEFLNRTPVEEDYDEYVYPEKYRKAGSRRDHGADQIEPFDVGLICEIFSITQDVTESICVFLLIRKYYRPHNTHLHVEEANRQDLNLLCWSDEECIIRFDHVQGRCFVAFDKILGMDVAEWSDKGPYRFYFSKKYDRIQKKFVELSTEDAEMATTYLRNVVPIEWPKIDAPLAMMDVFSGCGGLSEGFRQSGVAKCCWAIEKNENAAAAYQKNHTNTQVYEADCDDQLEEFKFGDSDDSSEPYPRKGEVELLCGSPPFIQFSKIERSADGSYPSFEDSFIGSYLLYCDHFRPKFFILENSIRGFSNMSKGKAFQLCLSNLVNMGYQVTFGVLQCGQYGVPQNRRRVVILAAAPCEILPMLPEPTHAFLNDKKIIVDQKWTSAPYRAMKVGDAICDLPVIENDDYHETMLYGRKPKTHYQRLMRGSNSTKTDLVKEHICKTVSSLNLQRITLIPRKGDWRDLPNTVVKFAEGKWSNKLRYTHRDWKNGESRIGEFRGVCSCAVDEDAVCEKIWKQDNTLIPWCLPHTGNRHAHWNGLIGRLDCNTSNFIVFSNPDPMARQGRVVHPVQNRVVSVRECARCQGLPDRFEFNGTILQKYDQIGHANAPPVAKAIGHEIRKCIAKRNNMSKVPTP